MRVFVTGATGFIGMAVTKDLVAAGHQVIGLCRSEAKAQALSEAGAELYRGTIDDLDGLRDGVARADAVIHLAFKHDFENFVANAHDDRRVVGWLGAALTGSSRPLIVTSGTVIANSVPGEPAKEDNQIIGPEKHPRAITELAAADIAAAGVNVSVMRLPQVHDPRRQGLISPVIGIYRNNGACAYVGDGAARWPAAHVRDVARLYRLAIEKAEPNATYHAVAEEGVTLKAIAETIGKRLDLPVKSIAPEEAQSFFGWLSMFAAYDAPASSAQTREKLGWTPTGPGMLEDLAELVID